MSTKKQILQGGIGVCFIQIKLQIESTETGRLLRKDVKVIKDEVVQCAALIDSLTNHNRLHSDHQV